MINGQDQQNTCSHITYSFLSLPFLQDLGIGAWGYTEDLTAPSFAYFQQWQQSKANPFSYLKKHSQERADLRQIFPSAQSALVFILPYLKAKFRYQERTSKAAWRISGHSMAYDGLDYHWVGKNALAKIKRAMENDACLTQERLSMAHQALNSNASLPPLNTMAGIDTGPVLEKDLAVRAKLGFIGRHGLLQTPFWGSYVFIAYLILDCRLKLPHSCNSYSILDPGQAMDASSLSYCTNCPGLCQRACPVQRWPHNEIGKCLAAVTIEKEVPLTAPQNLHGQLLGCDRCQDACPLNQKLLAQAKAESLSVVSLGNRYRDDFGRQENVAANQNFCNLFTLSLPEILAQVQHLSKRGLQKKFKQTVLAYIGRDKFVAVLQAAVKNSSSVTF